MKTHQPNLNHLDKGRTNESRARSGAYTIYHYWKNREDVREVTPEQDAADLIADVLHFVHREKGDPVEALGRAIENFAIEIEETFACKLMIGDNDSGLTVCLEPAEETNSEAGRVTLPAMSHAEIVDCFPILRDMRDGFGWAGTEKRNSKLENVEVFYGAARAHGGGAEILAAFICELIHGARIVGSRYTLANFFSRIDKTHRAAVLHVLEQVSVRGVA